jgi:hypothetical protein
MLAGGKKAAAESQAQNRRRAYRYPLTLEVRLTSGQAVTTDVSISGVRFETDVPHFTGDVIDFQLRFDNGALHCRGRVTRVEWLDGKFAVGVAIEESRFQ